MKTCPKCHLRYPDETTFCFVDGSTLEAAGDGLQGRTLGGMYVVDERVGESGWSVVHQARYRLLAGRCLVKLLKDPIAEAQREPFLAALKFSRRYAHPNIAGILSGGIEPDGQAFVVRPFIEAEPLSALLAAGPLSVERTVRIVVQLLRALDRIHDFGGAHGDLRPANILLGAEDHAYLVDAGLGRSSHRARWEPSADALAAQGFLAPELGDGPGTATADESNEADRAGIASDLYALGMTAAYMVSGQPLLVAPDVEGLRAKLAEPLPDALGGELGDVPEALVRWIEVLVQHAPERRPASAHQALRQLQPFCDHGSIELPPEPDGLPHGAGASGLASLFGRWDSYSGILAKMVETGFPTGAPAQTQNALAGILGRVKDLAEVGKQAEYQHGVLGDVQARAQEGRARIAGQMQEFTDQANAIRAEVQPLDIAATRHAAAAAAYPEQMQELHREVIRWEGRSGFREPFQELAKAYLALGELVEKWFEVRGAQTACEQKSQKQSEQLATLDSQLEELRQALRIHESNVHDEVTTTETAVAELATRLDELEPELLDMATRLAAPLRAKPELSGCFRELEEVGR